MSKLSDAERFLASRFWRCAVGFWCAPGAGSARVLTLVLTSSVVLQLGLQYRLNFWSRDFFDAFGRRDSGALWFEAVLFLVLAGLSIGVAVLAIWARMTVQRRWRAWLTRHLIERWLADDRLGHLHFLKAEDGNPEYRIAEDARVATEAPINLAVGLLSAILSAATFIGILWNVGGDLTVEVLGMAMTVPKYLVIVVTAYSVLLTVGMSIIGRRMSRVMAGKNAAEAEFRSAASDLREIGSSDGVAGAVGDQRQTLDRTFNNVITRWRHMCSQLMRTTVLSHGNVLAAPVIGWVLCAPKYLAGTMTLGEVAQAVAAFVMVQTALNWLVDNYPGLAECLSSVNRVGSLLVAMDELHDTAAAPLAEQGSDVPLLMSAIEPAASVLAAGPRVLATDER